MKNAGAQGRKCGIEEDQLPEVVRFLHNVGAVIHFNDAFGDLSDLVIINPQWLASVISQSHGTRTNAHAPTHTHQRTRTNAHAPTHTHTHTHTHHRTQY